MPYFKANVFKAHFYIQPLKKCGILWYTLRSNIALSVRPSVGPSVTISFPFSILSIFRPIFIKLYIRVDIGEELLGIVVG